MAHSKKIYKILFLLFFTQFLVYGQHIKGKILDKNSHEPLENVSVFLNKNSNIGVSSDKNGNFNLKLDTGSLESDSLSFSMIGYETYVTTIALLRARSNVISLSNAVDILDQVTLKSESLQANLKYSKLTSLSFGLHAFASIVVDNKLYISGGDKSNFEDTFREAMERASAGVNGSTFMDVLRVMQANGSYKGYSNKLLIYDLETNIWTKSKIDLEQRAYHEMNYYDHKLYILGGKKLSGFNKDEYLNQKIEIVDIKNETVLVDATNPHQAVNFASFIYKNNLIVMGGSTSIKSSGEIVYSDRIDLLNLKTGFWYDLAKLKSPKDVSGVIINDNIYMISGVDPSSNSELESWNLNTGEWTVEGELFSTIEKPATIYLENTIYIYYPGYLLTYKINEKVLRKYAINLRLKAANLQLYKDALYIIGGYEEKEYATRSSSAIYTVELSEFKKTMVDEAKSF